MPFNAAYLHIVDNLLKEAAQGGTLLVHDLQVLHGLESYELRRTMGPSRPILIYVVAQYGHHPSSVNQRLNVSESDR